MKEHKIKTILSLVVTAIASLIIACSPPNDSNSTAGVLTETESGHTIAFATDDIYSSPRKISARVKFSLTQVIDGKTVLYDTATTNKDGYAVFKNVKGAYSVVAATEGEGGKKDSLFGAQILKWNDEDTIYVGLSEPAILKISVDYDSLDVGDTICITGLLKCKQITKEDAKSGFAIIDKIPLVNNSDYGEKQIEIFNGKKFFTKDVYWDFKAGDTLFVNNNADANILYSIEVTLPKFDLLDSLDDHALDSLLIPLRKEGSQNKSMPQYVHDFSKVFIDEQGNVLTSQGWDWFSEDSIISWFALHKISSVAKLTAVAGEIQWSNFDNCYSRLRHFGVAPKTDTLLDVRSPDVFSEDSSLAISFWFELENLAKDKPILSAGTDSLGFDIRRCSKDSSALCVKIYNGIDSASTDSAEYGKATALDGKLHHYSLVIHKKHLTIAIDGNTVRDTDLKLSEDFYGIKEIKIGAEPLQKIMLYSFGDFIKHKNEKSWIRLKAWLYAFYEMQKDI